jgi:hypothetical protein
MLKLNPGDLCVYEDDGVAPREILDRVLVFLYHLNEQPDEGMFLCNDGTIDEEFFVFLKPL